MTHVPWGSIYNHIADNNLEKLRALNCQSALTVNPPDDHSTLLFYAVTHDAYECAEWLISIGASIEQRLLYITISPLMRAVMQPNMRFVKMILNAGAQLEATMHGSTALSFAYEHGYMDPAVELIDRGAKLTLDNVRHTHGVVEARREIVAYYEARQQRRARERALMAGLRAAGAHKDSIRLFETKK